MGKKNSSSKKDKKKKKGPKSKKGRAKAKLDRQWGEIATEGGQSTARIGKSRLGTSTTSNNKLASIHDIPNKDSSKPQGKNYDNDNDILFDENKHSKVNNSFPPGITNDDDDDDDDDSSSNESTSGHDKDTDNHAYSTLIKSIQSKKQNGDSDDDYDNHEDSYDEMDQNDENDDFGDYETDNDDDDTIIKIASTDPHSARFSRQNFPDDEELKRNYALNHAHDSVIKVDSRFLPDSFNDENSDLQISKILANKLQLDIPTADQLKREYRYFGKLSKAYLKAHVREHLKRQWESRQRKQRTFEPIQAALFPFLINYADMLVTNVDSKFPRESAQIASLLHISNHVLTNRGRINKHNRRIKELEHSKSEQEKNGKYDEDDDIWRRDQGYTRPTVLVLMPTRKTCFEFVKTMIQLLGCSLVENMDRFDTEYGPPEALEAEERLTNEEQRRRRKMVIQQKGNEWNDLFGDDANDDDDFKLGISFMPKNVISKKSRRPSSTANDSEGNFSLKLFSDFYKSDIIVASPLGLKMTTTAVGNASDDEDDDIGGKNEPGKADFLSSIEICLVMRAEVMLMQNWDHVNDVLALINRQPEKITSYTDFSRVRQYFLAGHGAHWRQLIVYSSFTDPCILSTFKRYAMSIDGIVRFRRRYTTEDASISNVLLPAQRQVFQRISCLSLSSQNDDRIKYFADIVLPQLTRHLQKHTLIFISSYFDYVSIRNILLKKESIDFVSVTEYSKNSEVSRNRAHFLKGYKPLMLYTGRAHFFLRHYIKGVRHLIFFGLPEHAEFYSDHVNRLNEGLKQDNHREIDASDVADTSCLVLFSKYESHSLERIVGTKNCSQMIKGTRSTFVFSS